MLSRRKVKSWNPDIPRATDGRRTRESRFSQCFNAYHLSIFSMKLLMLLIRFKFFEPPINKMIKKRKLKLATSQNQIIIFSWILGLEVKNKELVLIYTTIIPFSFLVTSRFVFNPSHTILLSKKYNIRFVNSSNL